jgi:chemotaxis methyl-accepting protein methylase
MPAENPTIDIHPESYRFLQDYVYRESGIVLEADKHYLLEARLSPIVHQMRLSSVNDLCALLRATMDGPLKQQIVDAMTTNETYFFREPAQYDNLENDRSARTDRRAPRHAADELLVGRFFFGPRGL